MKRIFWGGLWLGLLLAGRGAGAQAAAGSRAHIYPVCGRSGNLDAGFSVPQVRLPNAGVAQRINRELACQVLQTDAYASARPVSLRQMLRNAAKECCYDANAGRWLSAGGGLTSTDYKVLLNRGYLLSLAIENEYTGAYHTWDTNYLTFDLRTGRRLTLADVVADPLAQLDRRMQGAINRRFGEALAEAKAAHADSATLDYMAERFDWDWQTNRVRATAMPDSVLTDALRPPDEFALTPTALLLFYSAGFHRLRPDFEPDDTYRFPYSRLHPRPLLRPLLAAAAPAKVKAAAKNPATQQK